ncbi:MAG: hypothetical protein V4733_10920 [Verrucomicrobiota bacterium]
MAAKKSPKSSAEGTEPKKRAAKKAAKKSATPAKTESAAPKTAAKSPSKRQLTPDAISCEAFHVYERRIARGLPGDPHGDWLEAERILRSRL